LYYVDTTCEALQDIREPLINRIIAVGSAVLAKIKASQPIDILKLIINPFIYVDKYDRTQKKSLETIGEVLEPIHVDSYYIKSITKDTNSYA
jgi:hypothetical protein